MTSEHYPDGQMMFAEPVPEQWQRFAQIREDICIDYCYNTARAYWGDLDDIFRWAVERGKDVCALTDKDRTQYVALLRRRKYSENTIRRKRIAWMKLEARSKYDSGVSLMLLGRDSSLQRSPPALQVYRRNTPQP